MNPGPGGDLSARDLRHATFVGGIVVKDVLLFVVKVVLYLAVLIADFVGDTLVFFAG